MDELVPGRTMKKNINKRIGQLLIIAGAMMLTPTLAPNYLEAAVAPNGLYIPESRYKIRAADVAQGKKGIVRHTFRIYNVRPRILRVEATPDCGCTSISWHQTSVAPFGWRDLTVETNNIPGRKWSLAVALKSNLKSEPWDFVFLTN